MLRIYKPLSCIVPSVRMIKHSSTTQRLFKLGAALGLDGMNNPIGTVYTKLKCTRWVYYSTCTPHRPYGV